LVIRVKGSKKVSDMRVGNPWKKTTGTCGFVILGTGRSWKDSNMRVGNPRKRKKHERQVNEGWESL